MSERRITNLNHDAGITFEVVNINLMSLSYLKIE